MRRAIFVALIAISAFYAAETRLSASEDAPLGGPLQHGKWLGTEIVFFLVGMFVADVWTMREERTSVRVRRFAWDVLWIVGLIAVLASYRLLESTWLSAAYTGHVVGMSALLSGLVLVTLGAFRGRIVRAALSNPLVTAIGGACYTIYLLHFLVISFAGRFIAPHVPSNFEAMVTFAALPFALVVTALSLCAFPLIERPFMFGDWPRIAWTALRTLSVKPLSLLFSKSEYKSTP